MRIDWEKSRSPGRGGKQLAVTVTVIEKWMRVQNRQLKGCVIVKSCISSTHLLPVGKELSSRHVKRFAVPSLRGGEGWSQHTTRQKKRLWRAGAAHSPHNLTALAILSNKVMECPTTRHTATDNELNPCNAAMSTHERIASLLLVLVQFAEGVSRTSSRRSTPPHSPPLHRHQHSNIHWRRFQPLPLQHAMPDRQRCHLASSHERQQAFEPTSPTFSLPRRVPRSLDPSSQKTEGNGGA